MPKKYTKIVMTGVGVAIGGILFAKFGKNATNDLLTKIGLGA